MLNPLIWLISTIIDLVELALIIWIVLSLLVAFNIVNRGHPLVDRVYYALNRMFEPMLRPIRRYLPDLGGIDLSPVVLILLLQFLQYSLFYLFARV